VNSLVQSSKIRENGREPKKRGTLPIMNATFRLRRSYRNEGLGFLPFFLAWFGLIVYLFGNESTFGPRFGMMVFMGIVPLFMAGLAVWSVLAYFRADLTILDNLVTYRGVLREKTIDLRDVIHARWRISQQVGSVVLKTGSVRLVINFHNYEAEEQEQIVGFLRSVLRPENQVGWNLFAYKTEKSLKRSRRIKAGPDDILVKRDRYDRYLWPSLVPASLAGIITGWMTANPAWLGLPLGPIVMWAWFRALIPAEGTIETKLSMPKDPETIRTVGFLAIWFLLAFVGVGVYGYFEPRMAHPDAILIGGVLAWVVVLFVEGFRLECRQARRTQEAADLAAKGRGEAVADLWETE
jgi:hypothetical protein